MNEFDAYFQLFLDAIVVGNNNLITSKKKSRMNNISPVIKRAILKVVS
jgi:hypothetical protein